MQPLSASCLRVLCAPAVVLALAALGCGGETAEEAPVDTTDRVGLYEIPISRNNQASRPSDPLRVEISPTELLLNHRSLLALERGRPPAAEVADHVITRLRQEITSGAARSQVALRIHANVPYLTLVEVLHTLHSAGLRDVLVAVRTLGATPTEAWMQWPHFTVVPAGDEPPTFGGRPIPWDEFVTVWRSVYDACRAGQYVDCDAPYTNTARGGDLEIELWTRGQGMKVSFRQINAPAAERPRGGGGPALIEGVAPAPAAPAQAETPGATEGAFTVRQQDATSENSSISAILAPTCADSQCRAVFVTDATTPAMRVVSFLGAAFPNGTQRPQVAFRIPR